MDPANQSSWMSEREFLIFLENYGLENAYLPCARPIGAFPCTTKIQRLLNKISENKFRIVRNFFDTFLKLIFIDAEKADIT